MEVAGAGVKGYLVWEASDGRLSILVSRLVLERLRDFADREAGAVLLGHVERMEASGRRVVTIENFESGVSRLYDPAVVGFARCRRQAALHLADADFRILKDAPDMVCLMIRPDAVESAIGGFFYREGRTIHCPSRALQFRISAEALDRDGMLCVKEPARAAEPRTAVVIDDDAPSHSPLKRIIYAVAGVALLLSPYVIWRAMQHDSGTVTPVAAPVRNSAAPVAVTPAPAPQAYKTQAPQRLAHHGRLRHARNLTKHVR